MDRKSRLEKYVEENQNDFYLKQRSEQAQKSLKEGANKRWLIKIPNWYSKGRVIASPHETWINGERKLLESKSYAGYLPMRELLIEDDQYYEIEATVQWCICRIKAYLSKYANEDAALKMLTQGHLVLKTDSMDHFLSMGKMGFLEWMTEDLEKKPNAAPDPDIAFMLLAKFAQLFIEDVGRTDYVDPEDEINNKFMPFKYDLHFDRGAPYIIKINGVPAYYTYIAPSVYLKITHADEERANYNPRGEFIYQLEPGMCTSDYGDEYKAVNEIIMDMLRAYKSTAAIRLIRGETAVKLPPLPKQKVGEFRQHNLTKNYRDQMFAAIQRLKLDPGELATVSEINKED